MQEFLRLIAGSCRLYAAEQTTHSLLLMAAGLLFAFLLGLGLLVWARSFNRSYTFSAAQIVLITIMCLLCALMVPFWFALNFAGKFGDADVRSLLKSLSEDPAAMSEIRQQTHYALSAVSAGNTAPRQDLPDPSTTERWKFAMSPDDESVLALANAYTEALSAAVTRRSELLSKLLSWSSAAGFLAADIRLSTAKNPGHPYDLNPGRNAFAEILMSDFSSQTEAAVFILRTLSTAILFVLVLIALAWLGFAAYRDIHVHWPSEI